MAESGLKDYESVAWYGMVAPAGLPAPVLAKLSGVVSNAQRSADMRDALIKQGAEPVGSAPREFGAFIGKETARYSAVIKEKGVMAE
jgi:tripartite-type tricarboxylate transporter receptor subunit TctC